MIEFSFSKPRAPQNNTIKIVGLSPNSAFEIIKIDFFFFCDFTPGPSLKFFREGQPPPGPDHPCYTWKKVTGHSKSPYLQHCVWLSCQNNVLLP